jgi:hypothetical protein
MAASTAVIANAALAHLGVTGRITTLSSDTTTAGKACRQFYPQARRQTLMAAKWQSQTKQATLTLVETFTATDAEWAFSYRQPEDCVTPVRILWEGVRNPLADQEPPFRVMADADSTTYDAAVTYTVGQYAQSASIWYRALRTTINDTPASSASDWVAITGGPPPLIHCDVEDAVLEYIADFDDPTRFDQLLEDAIAALLAWYVAPQIDGITAATREHVLSTYSATIAQAKAHNFNAKKPDLPPVSGWQAARVRGRRG